MIGIVVSVADPRPGRRRKPKPTLREIATAVSNLQRAEGRAIHALRDGCLFHGVEASLIRREMVPIIPTKLLRNAEWRHQHVEAPGARIQARVEDSWAEEAS